MHDLRTIDIPKINDGIKFEYLCRDIWINIKSYDQVQLNGRAGQAQDGVDIFGRTKKDKSWFGIQCKVRKSDNKLTKSDIENEVKKALNFNPKLNEYIICTTLDRDKNIQKISREINDNLLKNKLTSLKILFWNDIQELLKDELNYVVFHRYFKEFFVDNQNLGHAVGKLINLELGIDAKDDTHYELMIGKIPKSDTKENTHNYKGTYFLINFYERKMETFPLPCFESDLEQAFMNGFDRFRITEWINSIENIDDFIYNSEDIIHTYITKEKWIARIKESNENNV